MTTTAKTYLLSQLSVLCVEDDEATLQQLVNFLKRRIGTVYLARNGKEGLAAYNKYNPDVVITDIKMPSMDGIKMAEEIKKVNQDTPVIVTTAYNETEFFLKSIDMGVDKYVIKPINPQILLADVQKYAELLMQKREIALSNKYNFFILDTNPNLMLTIDNNEVSYVNKTFLNFLGYASYEELKKSDKTLGDFILKIEGIASSPQDKHSWLQHMINNVDKEILIHFKRPPDCDEDVEIFLVKGQKFPEFDRYIFSFADVTSMEKEKQSLEIEATTDLLTGVYNRKKLLEALNAEINRSHRYNDSLSLIMFDLDNFKQLNDKYGHNVGDNVLKEVSQVVTKHIRNTDTFARWGGDEFLILAPETSVNETKCIIAKLDSAIKGLAVTNSGEISSSFGFTHLKQDDDVESFINRVDSALYKAKESREIVYEK